MDEDSEKYNSFMDSDSEDLMSKDSLDYKGMRVRVYEETINGLLNENKALKEKINKIQIEMQEQEEKFNQIIHEVPEKVNDAKKPANYTEKLQSYYEAFVQLDKENHVLKLNLQELCEKLKKYEEKENNNKENSKKKVSTSAAKTSTTKLDELIRNSTNYYGNNDPDECAILRPINQNVFQQKEEEVKELKYEIEKLRSENETFKSMKIYIEEKKGKRASSIAPNMKITNEQIDELNESINHLEMEKSLLAKKLSSIEASLTRWIFRACDYKTDLQQAKHECDELKMENRLLSDEKLNFDTKLSQAEKKVKELEEKYESEKTQQVKIKLQQASLEADLEHSRQTIKISNEKIERLNLEMKNLGAKNENAISEHEKSAKDKVSSLNKQIQSLSALNVKLEAEKKLLDKDNESLKKSLNEIKRKIEQNEHENCDLKAKITKYDNEVGNIRDLKAQVDQLKSENQYFNKKIESLLTENVTIKKKFDSNLLDRNSMKCKYEEQIRELAELRQRYQQLHEVNESLNATLVQQQHAPAPPATHSSSAQTDDFNYQVLLKPLQQEYEQKMNDYIYKEQLFKKEIDHLKQKLSSHDTQFMQLNQNLNEEFKINTDIRERNEFLFEKCSKLKHELEAQADEFLKFKVSYDIEKEVLETTISQQKKFIDYIVTTHPELGKKYKLFTSNKK